jgi:hypothetical protein
MAETREEFMARKSDPQWRPRKINTTIKRVPRLDGLRLKGLSR